ncbi:MAG: DUF3095 domain-containing protein [Pseudomonadota bacterium]
MSDRWLEAIPVLDDFTQVANPDHYVPLPDRWCVGVSDVVKSTQAIEAGRYKAVNLAGAATISAVSNALKGDLTLFVFGGDGARFAVPPELAPTAAGAMRRVTSWVQRDLDLQLRVGTVDVATIRKAGLDVRVAFWQASDDVRYAMFAGGGLEWVDFQLKAGEVENLPPDSSGDPDLTGLSCQWGPIQSKRGEILSLIVKRSPEAEQEPFAAVVSEVVSLLEDAASLNPVPAQGPDVRWPSGSMALQSRIAFRGRSISVRRLRLAGVTAFSWLVFKLGLPIGTFRPNRYRREIAANTDYRKFDDALMMTVDCSKETIERLRATLDTAVAAGTLRYGMHMQDSALMTCVVPSALTANHMHFVDGAAGGYASAAKQMRGDPAGFPTDPPPSS